MIKRLFLGLVICFVIPLFVTAEDFSYKKELNYAVYLIKNKKFLKAKKILSKLSGEYSENEKINFYMGLLEYRLKRYEEAFVYYDRVLIKNPNNVRARLEMARVYEKLKNYKKAEEELKKALLLPMPSTVRKNANKYLKIIRDKEKRYRWNGVFSLGFGYDDNINNNTYIPYTHTIIANIPNNTKKRGDTYHQEIFALNNSYLLDDNCIIQSNFLLFNQTESKYSDKNIFFAKFTTGPSFKLNSGILALYLGMDKLWYGSEDYLHDFIANISYKYPINKYNRLGINLNYKNKNYTAAKDKDRESVIKKISFGYKKVINRDKNILITIAYGTERKKRGTRTDINKDTKEFSILYKQLITAGIDASMGYIYQNDDYKDLNPTFAKKRDDKSNIFSLSLGKKLSKDKSLRLRVSHTRNHSNIGVYSYKKNRVVLTFVKSF